MDDELISKKELLEITGISYGQLYRWKRKRIIPEEWFIKKSAFTGQETFFPKEEILNRIKKIMELKDKLSLDELADLFTGNIQENDIEETMLLKENIVTQNTVALFSEIFNKTEDYSFIEVLIMYIVDKYIVSGDIGIEEGKIIFETFQKSFSKITDSNGVLLLIRKLGVTFCVIGIDGKEVIVESNAKVIINEKFANIKEELKLK